MSAPAALWRGGAPLLLASASPARRALLSAAGLPVAVEPAALDERALEAGLRDATPADVARHLADAKAGAVSARHPGRWVLGADQVLDLDGACLSKPDGPADAFAQLRRLSGRRHRLHAAATLMRDGRTAARCLGTATLGMRALDDDAIRRYLALAGEAALRSVGCYEIEGLGLHLFDRVEGEHAAILGLPLLDLLAAMRESGLLSL